LKIDMDSKGVYAIAEDLPGFIASSDTLETLPEAVFDTFLVYYDVPRYQAKQLIPNVSIQMDNGIVVTTPVNEKLNYA